MGLPMGVTEEEFDSLTVDPAAEREFTGESEAEQAQRYFQKSAGLCAKIIVDMAAHSNSDRIRLQAATYVVERILGRVQDNPPQMVDDPYQALVLEVTKYVEAK